MPDTEGLFQELPTIIRKEVDLGDIAMLASLNTGVHHKLEKKELSTPHLVINLPDFEENHHPSMSMGINPIATARKGLRLYS